MTDSTTTCWLWTCRLAVQATAVVLAAIVVALSVPVDSFIDPAAVRIPGRSAENAAQRNSALRVSEFSDFRSIAATTPEGETDQRREPSFDRRSLLLGGASVAAAYFLKENDGTFGGRLPPATLTTLEALTENGIVAPTTSTVSSVEEALMIIESTGDKRFLHAVVASDYKFLYEQQQQQQPLSPDIDVEQIFSKKVPSTRGDGVRSIVPAATGTLAPRKAASLWPLENAMCATAAASCNGSGSSNGIHYAWPELGGVLRSNTGIDDSSVLQAMIVDGIDCGKMSLEDALEGDMQVLVQAPTYLLVPSYMESNLRNGLRNAFLI
eukprot:jgi/Psemu1/321763/estExt_fgenesh1_pg.C_90027